MKTILHTDDHPLIRTIIKELIKGIMPDAQVDCAHDGNSTLEKVRQKDYDLILLDVSLPGTDTFKLASEILSARPSTKILMLTGQAEAMYAKKYLRLGAKGYISKDSDISEMERAILVTLKGKRYLSEELRSMLENDALKATPSNPFDKLSPGELEVVQHLFKGEGITKISKTLNLHISTIGTMKSRIFEKLACTNLIGLNMLADINNVKRA